MLKKQIREMQTSEVVSVAPDALAGEAVRIMRERGISCVPVLEDGRPVGMFTERSIVMLAANGNADFCERPMREVMSTPVTSVSPDSPGHEAYSLLQAKRLRHLAVVDEAGQCVGVVSQTDIVSNMGYEYFVQLRKVSGDMVRAVTTLSKDDTAAEAFRLMAERGISCVVVAEGSRPVGILTERDAAVLAFQASDLETTTLSAVMSSPVVTVSSGVPVHEALAVMKRRGVRRLVVTDAEGRIAGVLTQTDVINTMEWRYVEILNEIIRDKEERYLNIFRNSAEGIFQTSLSGRFLTANPAMARIFGYESEDALINEIADVATQLYVDSSKRHNVMEKLLAGSEPVQFDVECYRRDGSRIWVSFSVRTVRDAEGAPLFFDGICLDISERKAEEKRLREREARYRSIVEDQTELICRYRRDGTLSFVNEAYARYYGKDRSELINSNFIPHIPEEDVESLLRRIGELSAENPVVQFEHRVIRPDGDIRWQVWTHRGIYSPEGDLCEYQAVGNDVTERKRAEIERQNQFNLLSTLLDALPTPVFFKDAHGVYQGCNTAFEKAIGVSRTDIVGKTVYDVSPKEVADVYYAMDHELLSRGGWQNYESRVKASDGTFHSVIFNKATYQDALGETAGLVGVILDITERKRAEEELQKQYNFVSALVESMPTPVFYKDADGVYQGCNRAFEEILGKSRRDILGKKTKDISRPELAALHDEMDREVLIKGTSLTYEASILAADGSLRDVLFSKASYQDASGKTAGLIGVVTDISERKRNEEDLKRMRDELEIRVAERTAELNERNEQLRLEVAERALAEENLRESKRFLETIINAIQDGISVLDKDLTILRVNHAMRAWYGDGEDSVLEGKKCFQVYHGRSVPCESCPSLRALADGRLHAEVVPKIVGGAHSGWMELYSYPMLDEAGAIKGVVEFVRDITERKKLEGEFIAAVERAEAANLAKSAFLANMSHEIRTPLNAVLGYIQLVLHGDLDLRQRERLTVAEESAEALLGIINDVLDYSKIEAGKLEIKQEDFNLRSLLETLVKEQDVLAASKDLFIHLNFEQSVPEWLRGDPLRLRQVLRNLVNNAVKYTDHGGVEVDVAGKPETRRTPGEADSPQRVRLLFCVSDSGIGISAEDQARIFDSFTQADSGLSKRHGGTGLGLAICKKIAELMGGSMWFESEEGKGSAFYFSVAFEVLAEGENREDVWREKARPENDIGRLKVLLVEDNMINQMFATDLLQSRGHKVSLAENGLKALEALEKDTFDVVLMDIQMPVMNGLEATRAIRAHDGSKYDPNVPIIGLSAFAMDQERERFLSEGLDGYITKPVNIEAFFEAVARTLGRTGAASRGETCETEETGRGEDVLDTAALFIQYRNKRELLSKVGTEFMARIPEYVADMEKALEADDRETLARLAHTIKGNASMFGAYGLRMRAAEIERRLEKAELDGLDNVLKLLKLEAGRVVGALGDFLARLGV